MMPLRVLRRVLIILRVCHHWRLLDIHQHDALRRVALLANLLFFWQSRCDQALRRGERLKNALVELGPIFVKFGQMLSTRRDLLPLDIAEALAALQDKVPPVSAAAARAQIEQSWGGAIDEKLAQFDEQALASASVAQVHAAKLRDGRDVVVKLIRPGIRAQIADDLVLLHFVAAQVEQRHIDGARLKPRAIIRDYEHTLLNELDLRLEAANTSALKRNFASGDLLYVPEVHFDFVRENVLVMERIYGIPIGDVAALKQAGVDMKVLAERGVKIFFTQVFRDRFFHADMHPGNIFVDVREPKNPRYIGIDCAIIGTLDQNDQLYLAENFIAFFNRDYRRIAELHIHSGWVSDAFRVEDFEAAVRANCEPIFGKNLSDISFGVFLLGLFQTARRFKMEVQPQLVLLQKTLFYVEGLGRQLYPELDLWQTALPFLDDWAREQRSPRRLWNEFKRSVPLLLNELPKLPEYWLAALKNQAKDDALKAQWQRSEALWLRQQRRWQAQQRLLCGWGLSLSALLLWALRPQLTIAAALIAAGGLWLVLSGAWAWRKAGIGKTDE